MPGQFVSIDKLWQGVSGQAPWQRKRGTVESLKNMRPDPRLGGAVTRNPTDLIVDLIAGTAGLLDPTATYFWTNIRGSIIAIGIGGSSSSDPVIAWDEDGIPLIIIDNTAGGFDTYLGTVVDPIRDIDLTVQFDTMIVSNRNVNTGSLINAFTFLQSFNLIKNGNSDGVEAINDRTADTQQFLSDLDELSVADGDVFRIMADENLDPAGFYVRFTGTTHPNFPLGFFPQHGDYFRIPDGRDPDPQTQARFTDSLMPHRLIYDEANFTLTLDTCPWRQRVSGKQASNRAPLFENRRIRSVEFFAGRLFLFSDNSFHGSRTNDFFNLFKDSVNAPRDDDPISQLVTQPSVGEVLRGKTCGAAMFINAENGQMQFGSTSESLTSVNGILETISDLPSDDIDPAGGPKWVSILDRYGDVHQYAWSSGSRDIIYQDMLTVHVPARLHSKTVDRIFHFGTTFFAVIDGDDSEINDIFAVGGSRIQSAWGEFETFETPLWFNAWQGNIRVVTGSATEGFSLLHYVHRVIPPPTGMAYPPRLDRSEIVPAASMTYNAANDETTIPHTGRAGVLATSVLVTRDVDNTHEFVAPSSIDINGNPVFPGERNLVNQFLGFSFTNEMELTKLFQPGDPRAAMLLSVTVYHFDTTNYDVVITKFSGVTPIGSFHAGRVGQLAAGDVPIATGLEPFTASIDPRSSTITIRSTTPGQMIITEVAFELRQEGSKSKV